MFAWLGVICFLIPLLMAIFGGGKGYCNWDSAAGALDKLDEETAELRQAVEAGQPVDSPHGIREELGDALFILCKIAQMSGVDQEDALHRACDKYQGRFRRWRMPPTVR